MAADHDGVRSRLRRAALVLFAEHGYDRTTAAGIAARAGVTERTFFRHFPDKREVLFDTEATLRAWLTEAIAATPAGTAPLATLFDAFRSAAPQMEGNRAYAEPRHALIRCTPALHERELAKLAVLSAALAEALEARGVPAARAALAAQTGMAAFAQVTTAWLDHPGQSLVERLDAAERDLKALLAQDGMAG